MKRDKIIYWVATGLLSLMMLGSAGMYLFNTAEVSTVFTTLGYPTHIIYPLAIAKILGLVAILTKRSATLKEWAYAGFTFDFLLAIAGHLYVKDGEFVGALMALVLLTVSYYFDKRVFASKS